MILHARYQKQTLPYQKRTTGWVCIIFLLTAALLCIPGINRAASDLPVQLGVSLLGMDGATVKEPLAGHSYTAFIDIKNNSEDLIVLRGVELPEQLPDSMTWYGPFFGRLGFKGRNLPQGVVTDNATEPDHRAERWVWETQVRQATPPILAAAVLFPGERISVLRQVALWEGGLAVEVTYNRLTAAEASRAIFFPMFAEKDQMVVFKRVNVDVPDFERTRSLMTSSTVVFPEADSFPIQLAATVVTFPLGEAPFPLKEALKRVDFPLQGAVYWEGGQGWVLKPVGDFGSVYVAENRILLFPECDLRFFSLLDGYGGSPGLILPMAGYGKYEAKMPSVSEQGVYDPGVTQVDISRVVDILADARRLGDAVQPLLYAPHDLDKQLYAVIGSFDPQVRLDWAAGVYSHRVWREVRGEGVGELFVAWPFGADEPQVYSSAAALKAGLEAVFAAGEEEDALLVLGLGKDKDLSWVEQTGFAAFCAKKGIPLTLVGTVVLDES